MDVQFGIDTQKRVSYDLPQIRCINLFAEETPSIPDRTVGLLSCPGMVTHTTLGVGSGQGIDRQSGVLDSDIFAVSAGDLYQVTSTPTPTNLGNTGSTTGFARFAFIRSTVSALKGYVAVLNGAVGSVYLYDNSTLAVITDLASNVRDIASINGRIVAVTDADEFVWSEVLDPSNFDALSFATAERSPDDLKAVLISQQEVWMMGADTIEPFVDAGGVDVFVPITGGLIERGLLSRDLATVSDNTIFWVGDDRIVYRAEGYIPRRISTHTEEAVLQGLSDADAAESIMWEYSQDGHKFIVIRTKSSGTFVYDIATGVWHTRETRGRDAYRLLGAVSRGSLTIGCDGDGSDLFSLSASELSDDGLEIERTATANTPVRSNSPVFSLGIDCTKGTGSEIGSDPKIVLRYSDDNGQTFSNEKTRSLGEVGEYGKRVIWRQLGRMRAPGRIWEVKVTDTTKLSLYGARLNDLNS